MPIDYAALEIALTTAFEEFSLRLISTLELSDLYVVGLYTSEEFLYLTPTANTYSAWREKGSSKWSPPDWVYHAYDSEEFQQVDKLMMQGWDLKFDSFNIDESYLKKILYRVLGKARRDYFQDSSVVLGLFMGGMGNIVVQESIQTVNPMSVWLQFNLSHEI